MESIIKEIRYALNLYKENVEASERFFDERIAPIDRTKSWRSNPNLSADMRRMSRLAESEYNTALNIVDLAEKLVAQIPPK